VGSVRLLVVNEGELTGERFEVCSRSPKRSVQSRLVLRRMHRGHPALICSLFWSYRSRIILVRVEAFCVGVSVTNQMEFRVTKHKGIIRRNSNCYRSSGDGLYSQQFVNMPISAAQCTLRSAKTS